MRVLGWLLGWISYLAWHTLLAVLRANCCLPQAERVVVMLAGDTSLAASSCWLVMAAWHHRMQRGVAGLLAQHLHFSLKGCLGDRKILGLQLQPFLRLIWQVVAPELMHLPCILAAFSCKLPQHPAWCPCLLCKLLQ